MILMRALLSMLLRIQKLNLVCFKRRRWDLYTTFLSFNGLIVG